MTKIIESDTLTVEELTALAKSDDVEERVIAAWHDDTPAELLEHLATDETWEVREGAAINPNTPLNVLLLLVEDEWWPVRANVAINSNTPSSVVWRLAVEDPDGEVCDELAACEETDPELLAHLARDNWDRVQRSVASNPNTPAPTLLELSKSSDACVALRAASNPSAPTEALYRVKVQGFYLGDDKEARLSKACDDFRVANKLDGVPDSYIEKIMWG